MNLISKDLLIGHTSRKTKYCTFGITYPSLTYTRNIRPGLTSLVPETNEFTIILLCIARTALLKHKSKELYITPATPCKSKRER